MESLLSARLPLVPHSEAGSLTTTPGAGFSTSMLQDPPDLFREKKGAGRFDYIGFALLAIGVGALQVALDKGQEDDWFGSHFITTLIVIAAVGLVSLVIWEWFQKEPIVESVCSRFSMSLVAT